MNKVINLHHNLPYDVYIGRGSMFGNPYTHITDRKTLAQFIVRTREEAVEKYKYYFIKRIESEPAFKKAVERLRGKILGCYCKPKSCHGDVIVEYLESTTERIVE